MWLADHMHAALHAERHVLEVCQSETPAVFTSVTLPAYTGQDKLSNETKCFDKWSQTTHYVRFPLQALLILLLSLATSNKVSN